MPNMLYFDENTSQWATENTFSGKLLEIATKLNVTPLDGFCLFFNFLLKKL